MKADSLAKKKKLEAESRNRILERGKIEFRIEPELLAAILDLAKERKVPVGPLIRQWVKERLEQELNSTTQPSQLDVIEKKIDQILSQKNTKESA